MPKQKPAEGKPYQCQAIYQATGDQCHSTACVGSNYCQAHKGNHMRTKREAEEKRNYLLTQYTARVGQLASNDSLKSLREEVAMLRMLLENIWNRSKNDVQLLANLNVITDLIVKVEKLVVSCHKLEQSSGELFDKGQIMKLATLFFEIVNPHIKDEDARSKIAQELPNALSSFFTNKSSGDTE